MKNLAIYEVASGIVTGTISADIVPAPVNGYAYADYDPTTDPRGYRVASGKIVSGSLVVAAETAEQVQAALIDQAKTEAERRRMLVMSPGGSKKTVYSLKQSEVDNWNDLGSSIATSLTAFLGLPVIKQKRKFRFALAEAAFRGEPNPAAAIARFAAGSDAANAEAARIEAIEQAGVAAIKAATTIAAKRAAYAAINWNWSA
jgi:hypothetical protein